MKNIISTDIHDITASYEDDTVFIVSEHYQNAKYLRLTYRKGVLDKVQIFNYQDDRWHPYHLDLPGFISRYIHTTYYPSVTISGYLLDNVFLADDLAISSRRLFKYSSAINALAMEYGIKTVHYHKSQEKYQLFDLYHEYERYKDGDGIVIRVDDVSDKHRYILKYGNIEKEIYRYHKPVALWRNIDVSYA